MAKSNIKSIIFSLAAIVVMLLFMFTRLDNISFTKPAAVKLDNLSYDLQFKAFNKFKKFNNHDVVIVDIDEKSLAAIGRWPWPRDHYAQLLQALRDYGVLVVAFDMVFSEHENNITDTVIKKLDLHAPDVDLSQKLSSVKAFFDNDVIFSEQLKKSDTVLGYILHNVPETYIGQLPNPISLADPDKISAIYGLSNYSSNIQAIAIAATSAGFVTTFPDNDGVIRKTPLVLRYDNKIFSSLSLEAVKLFLIAQNIKLNYANLEGIDFLEAIECGPKIIPVDGHGQILINYSNADQSITYVSASAVLNHTADKSKLENKIVFVGTSALGLSDIKATPLSSTTPGVEVHATVAETILHDSYLVRPFWSNTAELLMIFVTSVFLLLCFNFLPIILQIIVLLFMPSLLILFSAYYWIRYGYIILILAPVLCSLSISILYLVKNIMNEQSRRREMRSVFGQYVPDQHIDEILNADDPDLGLTGTSREMTVLFCDIRNFTTISEQLTAAEIKNLLNLFLTPMTKIIFDHRGTVDKYVGDMIVAFWGAPLQDLAHAQNAVLAALEMVGHCKELQSHFAELGLPKIEIGIGINSGIMNVGDMGSHYRRAYTVLGDSVNLASRIEGLTKFYQLSILVGENTYKFCNGLNFRAIDLVQVKGKNQPVELFEPIGFDRELTETQIKLLEQHVLALNAYRNQQWDKARSLFEELFKTTQAAYYSLYLRRIDKYSVADLPEGWSGVEKLTEK